jgi:hypothetical protein
MDRREIYSLTGSIVRVAASDGGPVVLFSVESAAGDMAVLRPCNRQSKEFAAALEPGAPLQLTAGAFDGVLHGTLRVSRWSPSQRMLVVDNPPLTYTQRRESYRIAAAIPVDVAIADVDVLGRPGLRLVRGVTHDVSQGGLSFTVSGLEDLAPFDASDGSRAATSTTVAMVLHTERRPILVVAEVLGVHPDVRSTYRARFDQVTPFDQTVLAAEIRRLEVAKVGTARPPVVVA